MRRWGSPIAALMAAMLLAGACLAGEGTTKRVTISDEGIVIERTGDSISVHRGDEDEDDDRDDERAWIHVDDSGDAVVRVFGDVHIAAGEHVTSDVVAVFGSVEIDGKVDGDVVAAFGSVKLGEEAVVDGDVVSVGGFLDQAPGSVVEGETVSVGLTPVSWRVPQLPLALSAILMGWIAAVFTGWLFGILFPARLLRVATTSTRRTGASLLLGLASVPGFVMLLMLLFVTVIGIPFAFLLPLAYALLAYGGQLAATYVLGSKLTGRPVGAPGFMMPMTVGTLFVAAFFVVGAVLFSGPGIVRPFALFSVLLGCLLLLGLTAIGTGAFLLSKLGSEPRDVVWGGELPAAVPAPVAPQPTSTPGV